MRLEAQRAETQKVQRKRNARTLGLIIGGIVVAAAGIAIFSADDAGDETSTTDTTVPENPNVPYPGAGASITGETPCPEADGSSERTTTFEQAPPMCIDDAKSYTATLETTEGDIVIELDAKNAPETVNNFVVLARYHFYDDVPFHRIVPGFVNQAGDPVGAAGTGDPGYSIPDELPADPATAYPPGTVAMANSSQPNTAGSQFFLVIGDDGSLSGTGTYAVFGKIVEGEDVSAAINALGGPDQLPTAPVAITSVMITEA